MHNTGETVRRIADRLTFALLLIAISLLPACNHTAETVEGKTPKVNEKASSYLARGAALLTTDPAKAVDEYKEALKIEPQNRETQGSLAFALHKAGRDSEATQIWKSLAEVDDKEGKSAKRWLSKVTTKP